MNFNTVLTITKDQAMGNRSKSLTPDLVMDFTMYKLGRAGYDYCVHNGRQYCIEAPTTAHRILRHMGDEFETAYFNSFDDMTATINIHGDDLQDVIFNIYDVTLDSGIQWGRLVGIFVFAAKLSQKCMAGSREDVVDKIIQWTSEYLEQQKISNWINTHGGWDGFVQFYKNPTNSPTTENRQFSFNWGKACSYGLNMVSAGFSGFLSAMRH